MLHLPVPLQLAVHLHVRLAAVIQAPPVPALSLQRLRKQLLLHLWKQLQQPKQLQLLSLLLQRLK